MSRPPGHSLAFCVQLVLWQMLNMPPNDLVSSTAQASHGMFSTKGWGSVCACERADIDHDCHAPCRDHRALLNGDPLFCFGRIRCTCSHRLHRRRRLRRNGTTRRTLKSRQTRCPCQPHRPFPRLWSRPRLQPCSCPYVAVSGWEYEEQYPSPSDQRGSQTTPQTFAPPLVVACFTRISLLPQASSMAGGSGHMQRSRPQRKRRRLPRAQPNLRVIDKP